MKPLDPVQKFRTEVLFRDSKTGIPVSYTHLEKQFSLALDGEKARKYRAESTPEREDTCTMCGKMCAVRNINKILRGEDVDIMD